MPDTDEAGTHSAPSSLAYWRHRAGLTQRAVAAALGVTRTAFSHWERGTRRTPPRHHAALVDLLDIPPGQHPWPQLTPDMLAYWRYRAGLTQRAVAAALGVTAGTFGQWERGKYRVSPRHHSSLAELLDIPPGQHPWPQLTPDMLAYWRNRAGLTQRAVAAALGVTATAFGQWERGTHSIPPRHHAALADLFDIPPGQEPWLQRPLKKAVDIDPHVATALPGATFRKDDHARHR